MNLTTQEIARAVRTRIVRDGMRPIDAARIVADEIAANENGKLHQMHESGFLTFACAEAERTTITSDPIFSLSAEGGDHPPPDTRAGREPAPGGEITDSPAGEAAMRATTPNPEAPPARRAKYAAFHAQPFDVVVPVGNTGGRKRLGDFTQQDAITVRNMYRATSESCAAKAKLWGRVARAIGDDTLEQAWARIEDEDRKRLT